MNNKIIEAFRRRLESLVPDEATLKRVGKALAESADEERRSGSEGAVHAVKAGQPDTFDAHGVQRGSHS